LRFPGLFGGEKVKQLERILTGYIWINNRNISAFETATKTTVKSFVLICW
jgi:hypothetical protein